MSATKMLNVTIDGRVVQAAAGQTIIQAAESAGIKIPSLCHHNKLHPLGACRMCAVEIENQKMLQPACTFPVVEGMVVRTDTARTRTSRLMTLQLLFSERGHYCMFCPMSGDAETTDCELQKLGYDMGITNWPYAPDSARRWPVDASHPYLALDHSRCILCRRCARACDEIAANHTLGVHQRGARAMIGADDQIPLGASSCISCGVCLQVCPTGALTDRRSNFASRSSQAQRISSTCVGCAAGCSIEAVIRDNQLLRIDGGLDGNAGGLLCEKGRFKSINGTAKRILRPRLRVDNQVIETTWEHAMSMVAGRMGQGEMAGLVSPRLYSESMAAFTGFFHEVVGTDRVSLLYGDAPPADLGQQAELAEVAQSDCIIVIGQDPTIHNPVVGFLIKRAFDNGARLVVVDDAHTGLDAYAAQHLHLEEISSHAESPFERLRNIYHLRIGGLKQLASAMNSSQRPVVVYGWGLSSTVYAALRSLPPRVKFLPLVQGANTRGALRLGMGTQPFEDQTVMVMLADDVAAEVPPLENRFTIVQAAYESAWTACADVVLPGTLWHERGGHVMNIEGKSRTVAALTAPPSGVRCERDVLRDLAGRLGKQSAYDDICKVFATA